MATHRNTWWALLVLAFACLSAAQERGQEDSAGVPTYRAAVSEVQVTFFATDGSNHPARALTTSDFAIVDNERIVRNFRSLARSDETSLDAVVLVDLSE